MCFFSQQKIKQIKLTFKCQIAYETDDKKIILPAVLSKTSWRLSPLPNIVDWLLAPEAKYMLLENLALTKIWFSAIAEMNTTINNARNLAIPTPMNNYQLLVSIYGVGMGCFFFFGLWGFILLLGATCPANLKLSLMILYSV